MIDETLDFTLIAILAGGYLNTPLIIVSIIQMMTYFGQMKV